MSTHGMGRRFCFRKVPSCLQISGAVRSKGAGGVDQPDRQPLTTGKAGSAAAASAVCA